MTKHAHPADRRRKLQIAGLSLEAELTADQIKRLDNVTEAEAMRIGGSRLRTKVMTGGTSMTKRGPSIGDAAVKLLAERGPMHYRDLAEALIDSGAVKTKGKTFAQTLSAELARRRGKGVERVAPGVYKAVDG